MGKRSAPKSKKRTRTRTYTHKLLGFILICVGVSSVTVSTAHTFLRLKSLRLDRATVQQYLESEGEMRGEDAASAYPAHIFIKWFVDTDIEPTLYHDGNWTISPTKASFLATSGSVGEGKNIVIYGHNTRSILGNIRALRGGEEVVLTTAAGDTKKYTVTSMREVVPTETSLVLPTDSEVLTLYTCSGVFDSKRFIVRAVPAGE